MHHSINRSSEFWSSQFMGKRSSKTPSGQDRRDAANRQQRHEDHSSLHLFDPSLLNEEDGLSASSHSVDEPAAKGVAKGTGNKQSASGRNASTGSSITATSFPKLHSGVSLVSPDNSSDNSSGRSADDHVFHPVEDAIDHDDAATPQSLKGLLPQARFFSGSDIQFASIADSSDTCTPGQLVVYRIGIDDPLEVIADALARGAAGILTEQVLPAPLPQCIVSDTDHALAEITSRELIDENGSRPDQRLLTIGVVGESGKTSTALCLATVLKDVPCRVAYETDLGHSDGIGSETSQDPMPLGTDLLRRVSEAADAGAAITILELNDSALRSGGYDQIGLDILVITGRNRQTNDFGPSPVDCALERVLPEGVVVVDVSDSQTIGAVTASGLSMFTYGVDTQADVSLKTIGSQDGVLTAMIRHEMNSAMLESMIGFGTFTGPLSAAAAVGVLTENPLIQVAESLSRLRSVPGRIEKIACEDWDRAQSQPQIFLDACGTPARAAFALEHIRELALHRESMVLPMSGVGQSASTRTGKLWCVLAPSADDSPASLMNYGVLLETLPEQCILTCHPSEKSRFLALSHGVLDGVQDCASMRLVADQERAIRWAMQHAGPHDTVVILGGIDRSSPQAQRADLKRLNDVVAQIQSQPNGSETTDGQSTPQPKLKLFNPEA